MSYDVMLDFDLYCLTLTCLNMFMTSQPANHVIGGFRSDLPFKRKREVFILVSMDYYKNLKVEDFDCYQTYWLGRVLRGLQAGYTYQQCQQHRLFDIGLKAGLTPEQLLAILGPDTGYTFPTEDQCVQTV